MVKKNVRRKRTLKIEHKEISWVKRYYVIPLVSGLMLTGALGLRIFCPPASNIQQSRLENITQSSYDRGYNENFRNMFHCYSIPHQRVSKPSRSNLVS